MAYLPTKGCLGCANMGLGSIALPDQSGYVKGVGDLSFDGTGVLGTGLFGYTPWYDTSQWTPVEWISLGLGAWYGMKLYGRITGRKRSRR